MPEAHRDELRSRHGAAWATRYKSTTKRKLRSCDCGNTACDPMMACSAMNYANTRDWQSRQSDY